MGVLPISADIQILDLYESLTVEIAEVTMFLAVKSSI
jgi:hypothetical protein